MRKFPAAKENGDQEMAVEYFLVHFFIIKNIFFELFLLVSTVKFFDVCVNKKKKNFVFTAKMAAKSLVTLFVLVMYTASTADIGYRILNPNFPFCVNIFFECINFKNQIS